MNDWTTLEDKTPPHMKEIRVWVEHPYFKYSGERERNAVYLAFDGNIYDAEEQEIIYHVTKWKLA